MACSARGCCKCHREWGWGSAGSRTQGCAGRTEGLFSELLLLTEQTPKPGVEGPSPEGQSGFTELELALTHYDFEHFCHCVIAPRGSCAPPAAQGWGWALGKPGTAFSSLCSSQSPPTENSSWICSPNVSPSSFLGMANPICSKRDCKVKQDILEPDSNFLQMLQLPWVVAWVL